MEIEITKGLNYSPSKKEIELIEQIEQIDRKIKELEYKMVKGRINTLTPGDQELYFKLCNDRKKTQGILNNLKEVN